MTPGATYDFLVLTDKEIRSIDSVELKWKHDAKFYEMNQWQIGIPEIYPQKISVFSGEHQFE